MTEIEACEIEQPCPSHDTLPSVPPSRCTRRVTSSPQVGLTWCDSAVPLGGKTLAVRMLGVLEDELLVQLLHRVAHAASPSPKNGRTVASAAPNASTSSTVVYTDADARVVAAMPNRRCSGWAQW